MASASTIARHRKERADALREEFERAVFLAILPELVRAPWETGGQRWQTREQFINGAFGFAQDAAHKFRFPVPFDDA